MKTYEQWLESGKSIKDFLHVGDIVDEDLKMYFLEVLFPACMSDHYIQIGEPTCYNRQGKPLFDTLNFQDNHWVYIGLQTTPQGELNLYIS